MDTIETTEYSIEKKEGKVKKKPRPYRRSTLSERITEEQKAEVITLAVQGLPQEAIANTVGIGQASVCLIKQRYSKLFKTLPNIQDYRSIKSDILAAGQIAALENAFSPAKLAKASFISSIQGFDILNKAERLETGKSTENVAHSFFGRVEVTKNEDK